MNGEQPSNGGGRKKKIALSVLGAIVAAGLAAGYLYRGYRLTHVVTDDAFVEGAVHVIAPRVAGAVRAVRVTDNQHVRQGDVLVEIDPDMIAVRRAEAQAARGVESMRLREIEAGIEAEETKVLVARAARDKAVLRRAELDALRSAREADARAKDSLLGQARTDLARAEGLFAKGAVSRDRLDRAKTQYAIAEAAHAAALDLALQARLEREGHESTIAQAEASLKASIAALGQARAMLDTQREQLKKREALLEMEDLALSYTMLTAPADGFVTRSSVEVGNQVQTGQPLMAVVSLKAPHVVANYKETVLHLIRPGQRVLIELDAYPGREFQGRVESIMSGTGAAFSLFPPENASGNYVKVVQRVPVKIVFDDPALAEPYLRVGMSAVPTILTGQTEE